MRYKQRPTSYLAVGWCEIRRMVRYGVWWYAMGREVFELPEFCPSWYDDSARSIHDSCEVARVPTASIFRLVRTAFRVSCNEP